jgi:hypothetical protein
MRLRQLGFIVGGQDYQCVIQPRRARPFDDGAEIVYEFRSCDMTMRIDHRRVPVGGRKMRVMKCCTLAILAQFVLVLPAAAQWPERRDPSLPRAVDGKVHMTAPAPRSNGRVDLSGLWLARPDPKGTRGGVENDILPRYMVNVAADIAGPPTIITHPSLVPMLEERMKRNGLDDPIAHCKPAGAPRLMSIPLPFKFIETPGLVILLHEHDWTFRQVFTDGRDLPADAQPTFNGYSIGRWDGDVFTVTTIGFTEQSWLDAIGHPHSDQLRVVERYRRIDLGHLEIDVTLTDPKALRQPVTFTQHLELLPDTEMIEYFCAENERDRPHYVAN